MKRKEYIILLLLAALFCMGAGQAWAQSITVSEDTESSYVPTAIVNGSFDNEPWMDFVYNGTTYTLSNKDASLSYGYITSAFPNGVNGGWNTTETQIYLGSLFEHSANIQVYNTNLSGTTNPFVEMNESNSAVLYQDLATHGNDVIRWSLDHAVRTTCGVDIQSLRVEIGAPEYSGTAIVAASGINNDINSHIQSSTLAVFRASGITNPDNATYGFNGSNLEKLSLSQTQSSDNASWHTVTGVYVIPPGQSVTRFGFIAEVASNPGCGNLLDNFTFSTLIGNLSAKQLANGDVELRGYWGETDTSKRLKVVIGSTTYDIDMTSVTGSNFRITIPVEMIGLATSVHVYHQDYENAGRTIEVMSTLDSWPFSYTGTIQTFTAPKAGIYQLRVWGAQGGTRGVGGGLGGYATCLTSLTEGETIYVYVGGQGGAGSTPAGGAGGWNGGGKGGTGCGNLNGGAGGGGATHISKVNNQVIGNGCTFLGGTDYIIVAGGGGGAGFPGYGGAGGGTEGGLGILCGESHPTYSDHFYYSTSQSYGANGGNGNDGGWNCEGAGGGGGGYYGGTANYPYSTFPTNAYANASGCGGNSAYNVNYATHFSTTAGQREGNGQAQITLLVSQDEMDEYVGKVLGLDGKMYKTVSAAQNAGTTASGVIAYWGVAGSVYGTNIGTNYKAIAISIDYPSGVHSWGDGWISMYTTGNDLATMYATQTGGGAFTSQTGSSHGGHPAISAAWSYSTARPSGASMWFLADVGQWNMVVKGLTGSYTNLNTTANNDLAYDKVNVKLNAAGATPLNNSNHWTVSEYEGNNHSEAWEYLPDGSFTHIGKTFECLVRPIFAFSSATPAVYTISYDANGGNGAPSAQTKDGGIDLNLSNTAPTRTGYTFAGWTVAQDGSSTVYPAGATYDGNADVTLYAQWTVAINGKLPGSFSVSATKKVCFSQGNLQYQGSTNSWRFAPHQYDFIGNAAGNTAPSASQTEWMDLFGWATSGWNNGNRIAYQPYSTSENYSDYGVTDPKSADETLTGEYANGDWGVYNSAQLGPGWRTMTRDEWRYLIYYRTTTGTVNGTSNAIYTNAKILTDGSGTEGLTYNICGVILFPDEFDGSASYSGVTWGTINNVSDWTTTCTTAGWEALEAAGCVFLPAAGSRSGTSVTSAGTWGVYWTSTASAVEYVDDLYIGPSTFSAWGGNSRSLGRSVRLASDTFVTLIDGEGITDLNTCVGQQCHVNYSRSFNEGKASTVCLPFAYTKKEGDGSFYAFKGITKEGSNYVATMTEPGTTTLTANTPYLYMPSGTGNVNFSGTYTIPAELTAGSTTNGDWTYVGTYETVSWEEAPTGIYGFSAQDVSEQGISKGQFVKVGAYVRVKPMRCYLMYDDGKSDYAGARGMNRATAEETLPETISVRLVSANGDLNAIGTLHTQTGEVTLDGWYTLDGTRLSGQPTRKGIYVNKGKKMIIK